MKKLLVGFLLFCLIIQPTFAEELYQYSIKSEIFENNTVSYDISLVLTNKTPGTFNYLIEGSPYGIEYKSDVKCKIQERILGKEIICYFNENYTSTVIKIFYNSDERINKIDDHLLYKDSIKFSYDARTFSYMVKLPEGTGLIKGNEQYYPEDALLGSDGRRSILIWDMNDVKTNQNFDSRVAYEFLSEFDYSILALPALVIIILVGIIIFLRKRKIDVILPILKSDEKKVYEALLKCGSGVKQKAIVEQSGYSKAKVSKVLKNLQERGIIRLERLGRTNRVYTSKKFKSEDKKESGNNQKA